MDIKKNIGEIEKIINYVFKDKTLLIQAFTRASFCNEKNYNGKEDYQSNEVLEFFGDSVLSAAIISILLEKRTKRYRHGISTELREGDFSNIRSKLSDKKNLSKSTEKLGLQKYLIMGEGDSKLGIQNEPSVMEDLFESIIGAVYIDSGMNLGTVIKVVSAMLDTSVYFSADAAPLQSFKNALQEFCADKSRRLPAPVYKTVSESGPDHRKEYVRGCFIGERMVATGTGKNQKIADTAAAEAALAVLTKEENKLPECDSEAPARLRAMCSSKKAASPEWRDLGESGESTPSTPVYTVECRALGISATGTGETKTEARARAAEKILAEISPKPKAKPQAKKKAAIKVNIPDTGKKKAAAVRQKEKPAQPVQKQAPARASAPKKKPHWQTKRS